MLLRKAKNVPVFILGNITVQRFMEYLATQAHYLTGRVLKSGSYGTKRSAFHHMFDCTMEVVFQATLTVNCPLPGVVS